jgi:hypothetical protein
MQQQVRGELGMLHAPAFLGTQQRLPDNMGMLPCCRAGARGGAAGD